MVNYTGVSKRRGPTSSSLAMVASELKPALEPGFPARPAWRFTVARLPIIIVRLVSPTMDVIAMASK